MAKRKLKRYAEISEFENLLQPTYQEVIDGFEYKGKWLTDYFQNQNPLVLELGCGKGEYTVGLAGLNKDKNYIGMDIKGARLWKGCKDALEKELDNVTFIRTHIELIDRIYDKEEVQEIWITFPDPQLKKRLIKKRLTSQIFLNRYRNILQKDNIIHLKTDNDTFFDYTLEMISHNGHDLLFSTRDLSGSGVEDNIPHFTTFYEEKWLEEGCDIHYLRFRLDLERENEGICS